MTGPGIPRLLLVGLTRINAADSSGNGLLMRGLLADWSRQDLAQIYSSGDNGDAGIAEHEFKVGAGERRWGWLFMTGKQEVEAGESLGGDVRPRAGRPPASMRARATQVGRRYLGDTGLYELLFPVRLSYALRDWVDHVRPDVVLAQGYSLGAVRLALLVKEYSRARLACFWSDDWPAATYVGGMGEPLFARPLMGTVVRRHTERLVAQADVAFAFGPLMGGEYERRYNRPFTVINHSDDPRRFRWAAPARHHAPDVVSLLVCGTIDRFRAASILDLSEACRLLNGSGVRARVCLIASEIAADAENIICEARYVDVFPAPAHIDLPGHLKGADLLVIAEPFDEKIAAAYRLSISSKAHLFMFSERPIIVYAPAATGLARYAAEAGWAEVVTEREPARLAAVIKALLASPRRQDALIQRAELIGERNHTPEVNRALFTGGLSGNV